MPSSWNTGTPLQEAEAVVKQGMSFFDTVINDASQAMASGAKIVSDAAEDVYDLLPEADTIKESIKSQIDRIPEPNIPTFNLGAVSETASNINQQVTETKEAQNAKI